MRDGNVNYQILTRKNRAGKYIPDYDALIRDAEGPEEEAYIRSVQKQNEEYERKGYPDFAGFAFRFVYVVKNSCGHYEMYQDPYTDGDIASSLETARLVAKEKCTRCHLVHLR